MNEKLALVFSGGGAKGAFGVGALAEIRKHYPSLRWNIVSGTSTGALITPLAALASHDDPTALDALVQFYLHARKKNVVESNFTASKLIGDVLDIPEGLYNFKPARAQFKAGLEPRLGKLAASDVVAIVDAVSLQTGDLVLCTQDQHRPALQSWFDARDAEAKARLPVKFLPFSEWMTAMVASSSIPGAIQPVSGAPGFANEQLVDGGVIDIAPLRAAIAAGATHIVTVLMSPRRSPQEAKKFENPVAVALRAVDILTDEVMRDDIDAAQTATRMRSLADALLSESASLPPKTKAWLDAQRVHAERMQARREILIEVIEPPLPLGETLDFDSDRPQGWPEAVAPNAPAANVMQRRMECGSRAAAAALASNPRLAAMLAHFSPGPATVRPLRVPGAG